MVFTCSSARRSPFCLKIFAFLHGPLPAFSGFMGKTTINLDGSETTVIKGLGFMGAEIDGDALLAACKGMAANDLIDTLKGLIDVGYVDSEIDVFYSMKEIKKEKFRINPAYLKDIREAIDPTPEPRQSKRVRRD